MTTFFYKTGGKVSRSLLDYEGDYIGQVNTFTLDDWWEEQYQTERIENVTYGTVGDAGPYGIGSRIKGSSIGSDTQIATGGYFIVGETNISLGRFTNAFEGRSYNYYPCMVDYYTELNYGSITNNATTLENHGDISHGVVTNVEYGHIWIVATQYSFLPSIKVIGKTSWKATEAFVGDGRLWSWGEQSSPAVYGSITDGKVRISGAADVDYSPAPKGRGILPLLGTSGIVFSPLVRGTGSLRKFTGTAYSLTINPDEKQMLFSFNGVLVERRTADYIGSGFLKNFSNTEGDKSFAYAGSGSISILSRKPDGSELSDEKHTESYNPSAIVEWGSKDWGVIGGCTSIEIISTSGDVTGVSTGCIVKVDHGVTARVDTSYQIAANNNAASHYINYGSIAETHTQFADWGNILVNSNLMPFGGIKIDPYRKGSGYKFNPCWVGRGAIRVFGDAKLPLFASVFTEGRFSIFGTAKTNYSLLQPAEGLFKIHSFTNTPRSRIHIGSGSLRKLGGSATSLTVNPDEKQLLFSFTGEHQVRFGYGTFEGHGNIKNLAGGIETGTFDYTGSGSILTFNKLEEAITSSYNCSSIIPWVDLDYGLILDRNNTTCISDSGDKTTDITAASGCVKVDNGTVLSIAPTNTYTIPSQQTVPSITEDYGTVTRIAAATRDYDWILGTAAHGMPSCIHGELDISGAAGIQFVPNWVGDGQIRITGVAKLPLFASHTTEGMFGHLRGEAITNFSLLGQGDGLFQIVSNTLTSLTREEIGEGILSTLSGAAECTVWNPVEERLLFSIAGGYPSLKFSHGTFVGDGILFNFGGGDERVEYSYTGSGSIITWNKLEEAITSSYNCSSIIPWVDLDYGRLVDLSNASCVHDSGDKTTDVTAVSGCIKVATGTTLSIAPPNTYNIPSQITVPSTYVDYGSITRIAEATPDYGWILGTTRHGMPSCIHGELDISGSASTQHIQRYIGGTRGFVKIYGEARLPLFASHTTLGMFSHLRGEAITNFSLLGKGDGLYHIGGDSLASITREEIGEGIFSTFSGAADSTTYNPDEKQLLFSFTGGYTDLKFSYGTFIGDGLFSNFSGGEERGTYSYTGSGSIITWNKLEEAITYFYNCSSIVEFGLYDYGQLVDLSNVACVLDSGDKTSDVTAVSGCIKVAPGTTLSIAPNNTYTIPSQTTIPSTYIDYDSVAKIAEATKDYGWILGTTTHGMPSCIYGEIDVTGAAPSAIVFNEVSKGGLITITGEGRVPLDAKNYGTGLLKPYGAAITSLSTKSAGDGLYHIGGIGSTNLGRKEIGDGIFSTFSGAADSTTYNPDEKQMLFSFTGGYTDLKFSYGAFEGDGILWNFAGGEERGTYSYTGSGSILTFNKLEEAITYWYNCSSLIEWQNLDYGLLVSAAQAPCVLDSGDKTTDVTAPSGCIKVAPGTTLSIAPPNTYTVPSHLTTATASEYYDSVAKIAEATKDYGWILGTVAHGMPSCIYGTFGISGTADVDFSPSEETKGLFKVLGASDTPRARDFEGSGDLFTFSGASETLSASIEGGGLFKISSLTETPRARVCEGTGTLRKLSGTAVSLTVNPEEEQMLFSFIGGISSEKHTEAYVGSGFLRNLATVETRTAFDWNGTGVIKLRSNTSESQTDVYDMHLCHVPLRLNYGLLVSAAQATCVSDSGVISTNTVGPSACVKIDPTTTLAIVPSNVYTIPSHLTVPTSSENYQNIADLHLGTRNYGHILGSLSSPACPFGSIEFYNEATCQEVQVYTFVASGESAHWSTQGIILTGDATVITPPKWNSPGDPPINLRSFTKPNFSLLHPGSGRMFTYSGSAEAVRYSPDEEQLLFRIVPGPLGRWDTYDWQPSWVTKGFIKGAIGEAKTHYVPDVVGEGNIWNYSGTAESITVNPEEKQLLFSFTGEASESYTRSTEGTGQTRVLGNVLPYYVPNYPGYGVIPVTGNAGTHYVPHVIGEGIIWNYSGTAESITVNPDEKQMLFSFIGERLSEVKAVAETGFGTALLSGEVFITRALSSEVFGRIPVLGDGHTTRTRPYIGSGFLRKLGGSAESITINPDEKQMLFSFLGEGTESKSVVTSGDGRLFGFGGAAITTRAAYETTGLYRVSGDASIVASLSHVGSGTLRKLGGSAESLTVNPDEKQLLFSFTGNSGEKHTEVYVGSGSATLGAEATNVRYIPHITGSGTTNIFGIVKSHYVPHVIGTGTLRKISGAAESITINPDEKQMLFSFTGEHQVRFTANPPEEGTEILISGTSGDPLLTFAEQPFVQTKVGGQVKFTVHRSIIGTGSLYTINGAAESTTTVPPTEQVLYTFAGSSTNKFTRVYVGSGSLKKLSGAAESITVNPDEQQMLFSFTGAGTQSKTAREIGTGTLSTTGEAGVLITRAFAGEGTVLVSGDSHTTRARDYVGYGFIPTFSGAAESLTFNPDEKQMLFSFHGTRVAEITTVAELSKGGTLVVGSTSGDPLLTFAEQPYVNIDVTGDSYDIRTRAYQGSGRLSGLNNVDQAFARAPYNGSGTVRISGEGFVQVVLFTPPSVQVWII